MQFDLADEVDKVLSQHCSTMAIRFDVMLNLMQAMMQQVQDMCTDMNKMSSNGCCGDIANRLERLETLFVCSSPSIDTVLKELLARHASSTTSQPDAEPSPIKPVEDAGLDENVVPTTCKRLNFSELVVSDAEVQCSGVGAHDNFKSLLSSKDYAVMEDMRATGRWEPLSLPKAGDIVRSSKSISTSDDTVQIMIQKGTVGYISRVDQEGDAKVFFPSLLQDHYQGFPWWFADRWVFGSILKHFQRRCEVLEENSEEISPTSASVQS